MKKNILLSMCASLLFLASCDYNEEHFPGFDELAVPTDVQKDTITLGAADYEEIAEMKANTALALSKDPEGKTALNALELVAENGYFTAEAPAVWYLPAYLEDLYPYLDNNSKVLVNYQLAEDLPAYLTALNAAKEYEFGSKDYKSVWGDNVSASFLSPTTLKKIPAVLKDGVKNPANGDVRLVKYAYSETEPSFGGGTTVANVYKQVAAMDEAGGNYVIVAKDKNGNYIPFGKLADETKAYGYMKGDAVTIENELITSDVSGYVITVAPTEKGYSMMRPDGKFIYQSGSYDNFNVKNVLPETGGDWKFVKNGDGTTSIINVEKNKTIKYDGSYNSYGSYADSKLGIYLNESCLGKDDGGFTIQNVSMEGVNYVWSLDAAYGWKAAAYAGGKNNPTESWIVSSAIDLSKATKPVLTLENAINYLNGNNRADFIDLKISTDYVDNVTTATWTSLDMNWAKGNNWSFVKSGDIDLSAYVGKKIYLALAYKSTSKCAPTVEFKNFKIVEPGKSYSDVYLYKEMPETEVDTRTLTRAVTSKFNAYAIYVYDAEGETWNEFENSGVDVTAMQPADYEKVGYNSLSSPETILPVYLKDVYPYAKSGDRAAVVYYYYASSTTSLKADEYIFDGTAWVKTVNHISTSILMQKSEGKWIEAKVYYEDALTGGSDGGFVIQDIEKGGASAIWTIEKSYGWKATGYVAGANVVTESWIVSPEIDLTKSAAPVLTFDSAIKYLEISDEEKAKYIMVKVSTNYVDDVTKATWTDLPVTGWPVGSDWTFVSVNPCDLSAFKGAVVRIAFCYKSDTAYAGTVEIKNVSVKE